MIRGTPRGTPSCHLAANHIPITNLSKLYSPSFQSLVAPWGSNPATLLLPWAVRGSSGTRQFGDKARTRVGKVTSRRGSPWTSVTQRFRGATSSIVGIPVTESSSHRINNLRRKRPISTDGCATLRPERGKRGNVTTHELHRCRKPCQTVPKGRPAQPIISTTALWAWLFIKRLLRY